MAKKDLNLSYSENKWQLPTLNPSATVFPLPGEFRPKQDDPARPDEQEKASIGGNKMGAIGGFFMAWAMLLVIGTVGVGVLAMLGKSS